MSQARITYSAQFQNSTIKGTISVPELMLSREACPQYETISTVKVLTILEQYLAKQRNASLRAQGCDQEVGSIRRNTTAINLNIKMADGSTCSLVLPEGFMTVVDPLTRLTAPLPDADEPTKVGQPSKTAKKLGYIPCPKCKGTGLGSSIHHDEPCRRCNGTGLVFDKDALVEQKDALLNDDRRKRLEEESESAAFGAFARKQSSKRSK